MGDRTEMRASVAASPVEVMAVITDIDSYPDWNPEMREVRVLSRDAEGRPAQVAFVVDAGLVKGEYVLQYAWRPASVSWHLVQGDGLRALEGGYALAPAAPGQTEVAYWLTAEPAFPVLGVLQRKAEQRLVERAVQGLKLRVEAGASTAGFGGAGGRDS